MAPDAENDQHRNPPGAGGPVEHREPLHERHDGMEERCILGVDDQQRSGQRRDRHRPHVDPVGRRQITRREPEKRVTVEDQRHHPDVEHAAPQPHRQRQEIQVKPVGLFDFGGQQGGKHGDRLGRHHRQQPGAADALIERGLVFLDREGGEDCVGQAEPEDHGDQPKYEPYDHIAAQDDEFTAENARRRHHSEKTRAAQMVDHVGEEAVAMTRNAQNRQRPQDQVGRQGNRKQPPRHHRQADPDGRERDDAGRHDHAEIGRRQHFEIRVPQALKSRRDMRVARLDRHGFTPSLHQDVIVCCHASDTARGGVLPLRGLSAPPCRPCNGPEPCPEISFEHDFSETYQWPTSGSDQKSRRRTRARSATSGIMSR